MGSQYSRDKSRHTYKTKIGARNLRGADEDTTAKYLEWLMVTNFSQTSEEFERADEQTKESIL